MTSTQFCEDQDIEIDTLIHEDGPAQMEINLLHGEPLDLADQAFLFKRTAREAALRHKMYATFMAKPHAKEPGSAMHIHQSVVDMKTRKNIFSNPDGTPSPLFFSHIGGLQQYMPAAMALFCSNVNSYRRLTRYLSAPDQRTLGLRQSHRGPARADVRRRGPPGGEPGRRRRRQPLHRDRGLARLRLPRDDRGRAADRSDHRQRPRSAVRHCRAPWMRRCASLRDCEPLVKLLGEPFVEAFTIVKEAEYEVFLQVISSWEREHLLLNV